jgi:hypothetical protein
MGFMSGHGGGKHLGHMADTSALDDIFRPIIFHRDIIGLKIEYSS